MKILSVIHSQIQGQHELHTEILSQKKQTKQTNSAITLSVEQEQTKHFSSLVGIVKNTAFQMLTEISMVVNALIPEFQGRPVRST